ncbi:MAG: protein kinase, partial [Chitinivibrionales bacterium]|nr:protein kinase [Chitinivibrionales bacterium]MBD3356027.1 protein kinase [Chitinivibrionales bacterium]
MPPIRYSPRFVRAFASQGSRAIAAPGTDESWLDSVPFDFSPENLRMATTKQDAISFSSPVDGEYSDGQRLPCMGERIGKCRVLERIATGGMAVVYKVLHEELEVVRAVKLLKPGSSSEWCERLNTEAKISAHLRHPNIVEIHNVDVWQGGLPYIEMEYIEGASLDDKIATHGRMPVPVAVALTFILCNALHYAHHCAIRLYGKIYSSLIHRDIKPANIMISSSGTVKLADFGIAQPENVSLHTVGSHVLGTYAYLSPEQLTLKRLDQRSDLYSLGLILYEMVTGRKAFPQRAVGELVQSKVEGNIHPAVALVPELPAKISAILDRALALKKEDRFASAEELGRTLKNALDEISRHPPR